MDQKGVFRFIAVLLDKACAQKESESKGASFSADFQPLEFELVQSGIDEFWVDWLGGEGLKRFEEHFFEPLFTRWITSLADDGQRHFAHFDIDRRFGFFAEFGF